MLCATRKSWTWRPSVRCCPRPLHNSFAVTISLMASLKRKSQCSSNIEEHLIDSARASKLIAATEDAFCLYAWTTIFIFAACFRPDVFVLTFFCPGQVSEDAFFWLCLNFCLSLYRRMQRVAPVATLRQARCLCSRANRCKSLSKYAMFSPEPKLLSLPKS